MYTNLKRNCCSGSDFYTFNYHSIPSSYNYAAYCCNCLICPICQSYKMPPKFNPMREASWNKTCPIQERHVSETRREPKCERLCTKSSFAQLMRTSPSDCSAKSTCSDSCGPSRCPCEIYGEMSRTEGGGKELVSAHTSANTRKAETEFCEKCNTLKSISGQQECGQVSKYSCLEGSSLIDSKSSLEQLAAIEGEDSDYENQYQCSTSRGKAPRSVGGSCADFLSIVCDNILESVQKSVESKLKEFSSQATEKFESLSRKLENNEAEIKYLCGKVVDKINTQNQINYEEIFTLLQELVSTRHRKKQGNTVEKECQCESRASVDTANLSENSEIDIPITKKLPRRASDSYFVKGTRAEKAYPRNIMKKDYGENRKPLQKVKLCLETQPSSENISLKPSASRFSVTAPPQNDLYCKFQRDRCECAGNSINSDYDNDSELEDSNEMTMSNTGYHKMQQSSSYQTTKPALSDTEDTDANMQICNEIATIILQKNFPQIADINNSLSEHSTENRIRDSHAKLAKAIQLMLQNSEKEH